MEEKNELKTKEKRTLMIVSLVLVLALVLGISFAYFLAQDTSAGQAVTTGNISLTFNDDTPIVNASGISPIYESEITTGSAKKTFSISSTNSTIPQYVTLKLKDVTIDEELSNENFKWALYENGSLVTTYDFGGLDTGEEVELLSNLKLEPNTTKTYDLYIYINENDKDQSEMMNKSFTATIYAEGILDEIEYTFTNLLDSTTITSNEFVSYSNGTISENTSYSHTDYIEIPTGKKIIYFYKS